MNTLERLKELNATTGKRKDNEDLGHWADRSKHENLWVRDVALPDLMDVVEALKKVNDYLGGGCPISQIISRFADDFVASGSQDGLVEKGEALQAALAKLEAPDEH